VTAIGRAQELTAAGRRRLVDAVDALGRQALVRDAYPAVPTGGRGHTDMRVRATDLRAILHLEHLFDFGACLPPVSDFTVMWLSVVDGTFQR
jgi:hypothetical protein